MCDRLCAFFVCISNITINISTILIFNTCQKRNKILNNSVKKKTNRNASTHSVKLYEMRRCAVAPRRIVAHQRPAQRARWLPIEPRGHARFAENVRARQPHRGAERVMADRTLVADGQQLGFARMRAEMLRTERKRDIQNHSLFFCMTETRTTILNSSAVASRANV